MSDMFGLMVWVKSGPQQPIPHGPADVVGWQPWIREQRFVPVRFYWLLAHPASAYYFEANAGEEQ